MIKENLAQLPLILFKVMSQQNTSTSSAISRSSLNWSRLDSLRKRRRNLRKSSSTTGARLMSLMITSEKRKMLSSSCHSLKKWTKLLNALTEEKYNSSWIRKKDLKSVFSNSSNSMPLRDSLEISEALLLESELHT